MDVDGLIQILLGEFRDKTRHLEGIVRRDAKFPQAPGKIKVAIGMRRAGKTYFLYQEVLRLLSAKIPIDSMLYINFEDDRLYPMNEKKLAQLVDAFYSMYPENHDRNCYLFFDEIQNVENWHTVIRRLHDTKKGELYLSGSSAKLLSKEIATSLRGRSLSVEIWPYSFSEFLTAKNRVVSKKPYDAKARDCLRQVFQTYLSKGGFPEIIPYSMDEKQQTLQEYVDVVIYRDIVERHHVKNASLIKYILMSLISNVGKPFSINKIYHDVKSQGFKVGKDSLYEYIEHIEDAYVAFPTLLHDKSIRKMQTNPKKLYAIDPGLVRSATFDYENDLGRLFENIIYLDLRRLKCKVHYYLTQDGYEIDFLVQASQGKKKLFQVVWEMNDPNTMERETRALKAGMKELGIEGEVITLDSYLQHGLQL